MPYFRLVDDVNVPRRWHLGQAVLLDGTEPRLRAGLVFPLPESPKIAVTHHGRVLDFSLTSFAVPVASTALAERVVAVAMADVQCVPVEISEPSVVHSTMVVLNVVRVVDCIDEVRSEYVKWTASDHRSDLAGQFRSITRLVLSRSAIPVDAHVFRLGRSYVEVVVSSSVKDAMESRECLGATFMELATSD